MSARAEAPSEPATALRGSGIRLAAEAGGRVLSLATTFLVARGLGVEGFGLFAAAGGLAVILAEGADLGLQATASRALVARSLRLRDMVRAKLTITAALAVVAVAGPALALAVAPGRGRPQAVELLTPLTLYFALSGWVEWLGVALRARGCRGQEAAVLTVLRAAALVAVAVGLRAGLGLRGIAWAHTLSTLPAAALGAALVARAWRSGPAGPEGPVSSIAGVLHASAPLAVNGALALLALRLELMAVYLLRGAFDAGLFGAALKVVESLNAVPAAVTGGAMPSLTREALARTGATGVREGIARALAYVAVPAAAGLALVAPELLALLGPGYQPAASALRVLAAALIALFMNTLLSGALLAVGRPGWLPRLTAARVALAAALALVLVPRFGAAGAAAGFLASEAALLALAARACVAAGFAVPLVRPLAVATLLTAPMAVAVRIVDGGLVRSVGAGALTYGATLAGVWRLRPDWLRLPRGDAPVS